MPASQVYEVYKLRSALDGSGYRPNAASRVVTLGLVVGLHVVFFAILATGSLAPRMLPALLPARLILQPRPPPTSPPLPLPVLQHAPPAFVPLPEIRIAAPPAPDRPAAPRAITRAPPAVRSGGHFGAASDAGLGLDVAASAGGGVDARGTLAGFEASVRRLVLAGKRQPALAWDRRNTCVVNYRVTVGRGGQLVGFSIDPCAVPEINAAAAAAIRQAAPFPSPPDLGAPSTEVHGSLIFHP